MSLVDCVQDLYSTVGADRSHGVRLCSLVSLLRILRIVELFDGETSVPTCISYVQGEWMWFRCRTKRAPGLVDVGIPITRG